MSEMSLEQVLLERRAQALAKPFQHEAGKRSGSAFLVFAASGQRYALEARFVYEVAKASDLVRVPGALPHLLGVSVFRGEHLSVLDIARYLGTEAESSAARVFSVVCGEAQREFALVADEILDLQELDLDQVTWSEQRQYGLTHNGTFVLEGRSLFKNLQLF